MSFGRMSEPLTKVQKVDSTTTAKSYNFAYKYEDSNHPTAPTQIGHDHYTYDANGNPTLVTNDSTNTTREMYLSLIHISEPTRQEVSSRMPSSA